MTTRDKAPASTSLATLANDLRLACMRISRRVRFESTDIVAPHQFSVMARLQETPRTPRELSDIERVSPPSMSRTVAALVERGLVLRADDPTDGRQVILSLTPEGARTLKHIRRRRDEWMASRIKGLSAEEREVLARASEILLRVAGQ
ncbi:MarR family transcriptional regulator [Oryzihumus sp.]|uniref:MarR family winged helix-turn-helix transcriptional regulator n=1 Tax=Oryzihumus sp. TaxID=1968903 RepID=UPI002ED99AFF